MEITIPAQPLKSIDDAAGLIGLCTLGAVNLGKVKDLNKDLAYCTKILVRALDNLLDYQEYPIKAAERFGRDYRALGVGVTNFAYYLAKRGLKYASEGTLPLVHETFEALQYYLLQASAELAKEKGRCRAFGTTKYAAGVLPIDKYKRTVDTVYQGPLLQDWEALRTAINAYGLRHTVVSAIMPSEKSSIISNATNGIEAPRAYLSVKNNKNSGSIPMMVPESQKLKNQYQLVWSKDYSNRAYLHIAAIIQKFIDQSISADLYYNPSRYFEELNNDTDAVSKALYRDLVQDIFYAHKIGLKTLYYSTTKDGSGESHVNTQVEATTPENEGCPGGVCTL
jgi:ribonucleoside-diphosphate reductase alpha chain